jgi:protein-S-isoprenylcysteine O-methyltransferase Ste14
VTADDDQGRKPEGINRRRLALDLLGIALYFALFLFLPAGTWAWEKGWLFLLVCVTLGVLASLYVWRVNPEVLAARINPHEGTKGWDKVLLGLFFLTGLATVPVAALDAGRFRWSVVPGWACLVGYALLVAGMALLTWAQAVNKFFEPTVRLQRLSGKVSSD